MTRLRTPLMLGAALLGLLTLTGCDDGKAEDVGETLDNAVDETGDAIDEAADDIKDAAKDLGDGH